MEHFLLRHQRHHCGNGFLAFAVVAWSGIHNHVVFPDRDVVQHFASCLKVVDSRHVWLAVGPNDPHHPLGVVNLRDQVQNDLAGVLDAPGHVVVEMEVRQVDLLLLALQGFARNVADHLLRRVEDAQDRLKVCADLAGGLHDAGRRWLWL